LREKFQLSPQIKNPITLASEAVAVSIGKGKYFARKIRSLTRYIGRFRTLPPATAGKHNAHPSLLNDERISQAVRRYLTVLADGEITPLILQRQVNNIIIPSLGLDLAGEKISESCARRWLIKLGYEMKEVKKAMYVDGHERPDVVKYRNQFLTEISKNAHLRRTYCDEDLEPIEPTLGCGEKLHVPIFHDESTCHANQQRRRVWVREGKMPLRKKGDRHAIHISDFIVEQTGRLVLNEKQRKFNDNLPVNERLPTTDAREIIYPGKNYDGWWNMESLIAQIKKTIPIFERMYPNAVGEFFFDQSSVHGAYSPDALNSKEMNSSPGGKQRKMHPTTIPMDNPNPLLRGVPQLMVFPDDLPSDHPHYEHRGKPKGMKVVLEERGLMDHLIKANNGKLPPAECRFCKASRQKQEQLLREAQAAADGRGEPEGTNEDILQPGKSITCCMRRFLTEQSDFKAEKPLIQLVIEAAGHKCFFLPKFHCELNPIEMYWGWTKFRQSPGSRRWHLSNSKEACPGDSGQLSHKNNQSLLQKNMEIYGRLPPIKLGVPRVAFNCPENNTAQTQDINLAEYNDILLVAVHKELGTSHCHIYYKPKASKFGWKFHARQDRDGRWWIYERKQYTLESSSTFAFSVILGHEPYDYLAMSDIFEHVSCKTPENYTATYCGPGHFDCRAWVLEAVQQLKRRHIISNQINVEALKDQLEFNKIDIDIDRMVIIRNPWILRYENP
ncbi:hypothetical protein M422DRAFT_273562, partial [Sphaerobolus stellatus SS14]